MRHGNKRIAIITVAVSRSAFAFRTQFDVAFRAGQTSEHDFFASGPESDVQRLARIGSQLFLEPLRASGYVGVVKRAIEALNKQDWSPSQPPKTVSPCGSGSAEQSFTSLATALNKGRHIVLYTHPLRPAFFF